MERMTRFRAGIVLTIFCVILSFFGLKLYELLIVDADTKGNNTKTFTSYTTVKAARGDILDRNGNVLVTNRASYDLVFNHYVICSAKGTNDHLLRLVEMCRDMDIQYHETFPVSKTAPFSYTLTELTGTQQGHFQSYLPEVAGGLDSDITAPLLIKKLREYYDIPETWSDADARAVIGLRYELNLRQGNITTLPSYVFLEDAQSEELAALLELNIPGLKTEASTVRVYNTKYAAHILGYVGPMTSKQWQDFKELKDADGNSLYAMDAVVGQDGLEEAFETLLHAVDGVRKDVVAVDGTVISQTYTKEPKAGQNVVLSIDMKLQSTAEDQLEALITALRATGEGLEEGEKKPDGSDVEGGAVVVLDVKTGQVLACASYPTYSLATFREDYNDLMQADYDPLFNRALQALYPPGSTYKMSMVVAGVEAGAIDRYTEILTKGIYLKYQSSGFTPTCLTYSSNGRTHGYLTAVKALQVSCNYFFYELAERIDIADMDKVAKALGLGEATGIELFERVGYRANPETKKLLHTEDGTSGWYPADKITAAIGQSDNKFTPMQLCVYTATLANRGTRYKSTFLYQVLSSDYRELVYESQPEIVSQFAISDEAYAAYSQGMRAAATSGTAAGTFGKYPIAVAAKTGTAQTNPNWSDNGAFVCYAPFDAPEIAVVVYGEKAGHGTTMGQIAKAITDAYFNIDSNGNSGENQVS